MGIEIVIAPFFGTDKTGTLSLNAWGAWSSSNRLPDNTSTWFTTNGGTFEYTGVQLTATDYCPDYPHISYGDELARCQRYYYEVQGSMNDGPGISGSAWGSNYVVFNIRHPVEMRANPSLGGSGICRFQSENDSADINISDLGVSHPPTNFGGLVFERYGTSGLTASAGGTLQIRENGTKITFSAEL